jgi:hypothetical protein
MTEKIIALLAHFIIAVISASGYLGIALLMGIESACIPLPSETELFQPPKHENRIYCGTYLMLTGTSFHAL